MQPSFQNVYFSIQSERLFVFVVVSAAAAAATVFLFDVALLTSSLVVVVVFFDFFFVKFAASVNAALFLAAGILLTTLSTCSVRFKIIFCLQILFFYAMKDDGQANRRNMHEDYTPGGEAERRGWRKRKIKEKKNN